MITMSFCTCHHCSVSWLLWRYTHSGSCGIPLSSMHVKDPGWFCVLWLCISLHLSHDKVLHNNPTDHPRRMVFNPTATQKQLSDFVSQHAKQLFTAYHSNSSWTVQIHAAMSNDYIVGRRQVRSLKVVNDHQWCSRARGGLDSGVHWSPNQKKQFLLQVIENVLKLPKL